MKICSCELFFTSDFSSTFLILSNILFAQTGKRLQRDVNCWYTQIHLNECLISPSQDIFCQDASSYGRYGDFIKQPNEYFFHLWLHLKIGGISNTILLLLNKALYLSLKVKKRKKIKKTCTCYYTGQAHLHSSCLKLSISIP